MQDVRQLAAEFYYRNAQGTSLEEVMTMEAADTLGQMLALCRASRLRREANKRVEPESDLLIDDQSSRRLRAREYLKRA